MIPLPSLSVSPVPSVVKGPERRRAPVANERPDRRGACFEALEAPPIPQACSKGVGELASPAPLVKPDDAIKYPFKPAELDSAATEELVWLWWETHRLKFAQPMGGFALFRKSLDAEGRKVVMVYRRHGVRLEVVEKAKRDPLPEGREGASQENTILCRTAPQFRFGPYAQPVTLVAYYTENPATPDGAHRLAIIRDWNRQARQVWDVNGGPDPQVARAIAAGQVLAFNVHTRRPTVQKPERHQEDASARPKNGCARPS